jgi:hypothetical protein
LTLQSDDGGLVATISTRRGNSLSLFLNWLIRGLTIVGGVLAVTLGWPIAQAAWQAQRADGVFYNLRTDHAVDRKAVDDGLDGLSRAIELDRVPTRFLLRSDLLTSAALNPGLKLDEVTRKDWLNRARLDLITGLAGAPAHGVDWLRLAAIELALYGPSRRVIALMFTSIEMAGRLPQAWESRMRVILDCWPYLTDAEKERLRGYMVMTWRQSAGDRRLFGYVTRSAADHAILTWFLRDEPGAPQELADIIKRVNKQ